MDAMFANGTVEARISGDGPPLVLLHSLLADRSSFDGVVGALAQRFRVMLPALPSAVYTLQPRRCLASSRHDCMEPLALCHRREQ